MNRLTKSSPLKCTGLKCPMQAGKVDPATCKAFDTCKWATKTLTNADRIRQMSNEQLAMLLHPICPTSTCTDEMPHDCYKCWLDWLKQEATDNG